MKGFSLLVLFLLLTIFAFSQAPKSEEHVIFLVRHAEKVDASRDPDLSATGVKRSDDLAAVLRDAKIQFVHSTDFIRTRKTALPLAKHLELDVNLYRHDSLAAFAEKLKATKGRHLVVGHSNTTPEMVKLLGGEAGAPIDESKEYDRLYIVSISSNIKVSTILMRFGEACTLPDR